MNEDMEYYYERISERFAEELDRDDLVESLKSIKARASEVLADREDILRIIERLDEICEGTEYCFYEFTSLDNKIFFSSVEECWCFLGYPLEELENLLDDIDVALDLIQTEEGRDEFLRGIELD